MQRTQDWTRCHPRSSSSIVFSATLVLVEKKHLPARYWSCRAKRQRSRDTPTNPADAIGNTLHSSISTDVPHLNRERRLHGDLSTSGRRGPSVETTLFRRG